MVEYHGRGKVSAEMSFVDDELDGLHRTFAEDGTTLLSESRFRRGVLHGRSVSFHPNGGVAQVTDFADGLLDGVLEELDEAGTVRYRAHFREGRQHGVTSVFDESGREVVRQEYVDGEPVAEAVEAPPAAEPCGHCPHDH